MIEAITKLGEAAIWLRVLDVATGPAFFPLMGLLPLVALIVLAWRSPKLPWFGGTAALMVVGLLCIVSVAALLVVVWDREMPRPHGAPAKSSAPKPAPARAPEFDIGG